MPLTKTLPRLFYYILVATLFFFALDILRSVVGYGQKWRFGVLSIQIRCLILFITVFRHKKKKEKKEHIKRMIYQRLVIR